jgi:hypothetical protein
MHNRDHVVAIVFLFEWRFKRWTSRMYFDGTIVLGSYQRYVATLIRRLPLDMFVRVACCRILAKIKNVD